MGPGFLIDLHVHTARSKDAAGTIMDAALHARRVGLHGLAITDHNVAAPARLIEEAAERSGLLIAPGVEVSTAEGHLLVLGADIEPRPGKGMAEILDEVRDAGGVGIPAHPLRVLTGAGPTELADLFAGKRIRVVETHNGRDRRLARRNTAALAMRLRLAACGGSDAHHSDEVGACWTRIDGPVESVDDVLEALRKGRCNADGAFVPRLRLWRHRAGMLVGRP